MELDRRGAVVQPELLAQPDEGRRPAATAKSYEIDRREVWQAYKRIKANKGGAGVDGVTMTEFETDLKGNLFRIWNRLSSGSYFPPPVKRVEIPKSDGKIRALGIPTIADRIAQQVVRQRLEPLLEPVFHESSYGYRPGRSAHDALRQARTQCWRRDWVLDLDIKGFFDNIDWSLLMKAVRLHTKGHAKCRWIELYIQRWLQADVIMPDGSVQKREKGTPQGGVISPLLANLYLHYAFDEWMKRQHGEVPFERYADDIICHCQSQAQAEELMEQVRARLLECKLELNVHKSKVVYCADAKRRGNYETRKFDFLGYTFKPRAATDKRGVVFTNFAPAVADKAATAMRRKMHSWGLGRHNRWSLEEVLAWVRPVVTGWVRYYGLFYPSKLYRALQTLDQHLMLWAQRKYKGLARHTERAWNWLDGLKSRMPLMFPHWFESIMTTGR